MARTCYICGSTQVEQAEDVVFFEFPVSAYLRRKWKEAIQHSGRISYDMLLCSRHFKDSEFTMIRGRPRLIGRVVPSLFLNNKNEKNPASKEENNEMEKENNSNSDENTINNIDELSNEKADNYKAVSLSENEVNELDKAVNLSENEVTELDELDQAVTEKPLENHVSVQKSDTSIKVVDSNVNLKIKNIIEDSDTESASSQVSDKDVPKLIAEDSDMNVNSDVPHPDMSNNSANRLDSFNEKFVNFRRAGGMRSVIHNFQNTSEVSLSKSIPQVDPKEDIEDILTNYHIQNKGQLVMENVSVAKEPEVNAVVENPPVFIEISVGRDFNSSAPQDGRESQDCLMVLESVQVDVDPSTFLLPEREYDIASNDDDDDDDVQVMEDQKPDPISLLTSSDESDVILEEPKIETVEVSDETDEDDVPLVRLLPKQEKTESDIAKIMWGLCEYYCIQCKFSSTNKSHYRKHLKEHEKVLQVCQICGFTTASKGQFDKHRRKHRDDRKFKCNMCDYKAKHSMSLIYHLKTHQVSGKMTKRPGYSCHCGFRTSEKAPMLKHMRACNVSTITGPMPEVPAVKGPMKYQCKYCNYATKRRSDLRRHRKRKHALEIDDEDEDYTP